MSGHWGHETVTISNLLVVDVDPNKNLILIKGSIPGSKNSVVLMKTTSKKTKLVEPVKLISKKINEINNQQNESATEGGEQ